MKIKDARKLRDLLLIVGSFIMLAAYYWVPFMIIGAIVSVSCLIPHFLYNRCPHCGKQLGISNGDFCQYCGENLD